MNMKNDNLILLLKGLNVLGKAVVSGVAASQKKKADAVEAANGPISGTPQAPKKDCGGCGPRK